MILHGEGGEQEGEAGHEAAQDRGEADGAAAAVGDSQRGHQERHGERETAQQPCGMRNCVRVMTNTENAIYSILVLQSILQSAWPAALICVDTQQIGPKHTTPAQTERLMVTNEGLEQLAQPLSQIVVS